MKKLRRYNKIKLNIASPVSNYLESAPRRCHSQEHYVGESAREEYFSKYRKFRKNPEKWENSPSNVKFHK
jgi:hypothetical protein